jgi:hypothetical protein
MFEPNFILCCCLAILDAVIAIRILNLVHDGVKWRTDLQIDV